MHRGSACVRIPDFLTFALAEGERLPFGSVTREQQLKLSMYYDVRTIIKKIGSKLHLFCIKYLFNKFHIPERRNKIMAWDFILSWRC